MSSLQMCTMMNVLTVKRYLESLQQPLHEALLGRVHAHLGTQLCEILYDC